MNHSVNSHSPPRLIKTAQLFSIEIYFHIPEETQRAKVKFQITLKLTAIKWLLLV